MSKKVLVLLAEGFEEVETITPVTYLRRAGAEVLTAAITDQLTVSGARSVQMIADTTLAELTPQYDSLDAIIIPGGLKGANNLAACEKTGSLIKNMAITGKLVCAICASPALVLGPLGILSGKKFTCYPHLEDKVKDGILLEDRVVLDGNIITSRAAGTSGEFAVAIIEYLFDKKTADKLAESVLLF